MTSGIVRPQRCVAPAEHDAHRDVADERPEALVEVVAAAQHARSRGSSPTGPTPSSRSRVKR